MNRAPYSPRRRTTMKDLATELGLSVSTISRAFTRPEMLHPETVDRVQRLASELGYRANLPARDLKMRSTGLVFIIVPSLHPFFLEVLRGSQDAAIEMGFTVVMGHTDRDPAREAAYFDQVASGRADGVILVTSVRRGAIARDARALPPTVVSLQGVDGPDLPTVRVDHVGAACEATRHLIDLGHRRLAHVVGPTASAIARHRRLGFERAVAEAGLPGDAIAFAQGQSSVSVSERAVRQLLERPNPPTAVFAGSDEMAVGAVRAAKSLGLRIPDDLSVVGFNDQGLAEIYDPPLTTVRVRSYELGVRSMQKLNSVFLDETFDDLDELFPTELVDRGSTAPPRPERG